MNGTERLHVFTLDKWYLDLVTDDGTTVICYSARLEAGSVHVGYSSVLRSAAGVPARETSAFGEAASPERSDELVTWHQATLGVRGCWRRLAPPIEQRLLETSDGELRWTCVMPRSRGEIDLAGIRHVGIGYVEHLTMTVAPLRLPFTSLRWGRYASAFCSIIWIVWRGQDQRNFIWHDGRLQPSAVVSERGISGLTGDAELLIGEPRDLRARRALERLIDHIPGPARSFAQPVAAMFEHKLVAPSRVTTSGRQVDSGWTVLEEVHW